ncbi:ImmA/IrrE family metallo-endopeptidase [Zymomonas mobilis]|uniref:ImmA/IrrE family metallo-endopeptidase n=1 Tax=Zymomonas mobilis TaxID=542 RepID=UPI0039EC8264
MSETLVRTLDQTRTERVIREANSLTNGYSAPPIPVREIAENAGVDVIFSSFGGASERVAGFCDFEARRLYVNSNDIITRQKFTMAHELGHWILHREFFESHPAEYRVLPRFHKPVSNHFEREADIFAANLLAPAALLRPVRELGAAALSSIFGVSRTMMELRLKEI